jgi:hypothetical protein
MTIAIEVNCETGEITERPLTAEELANREAMQAEAERNRAAEDAAKAELEAAKASAVSKLSALGLTADEIAALTK